jgi:hypothetical protein
MPVTNLLWVEGGGLLAHSFRAERGAINAMFPLFCIFGLAWRSGVRKRCTVYGHRLGLFSTLVYLFCCRHDIDLVVQLAVI